MTAARKRPWAALPKRFAVPPLPPAISPAKSAGYTHLKRLAFECSHTRREGVKVRYRVAALSGVNSGLTGTRGCLQRGTFDQLNRCHVVTGSAVAKQARHQRPAHFPAVQADGRQRRIEQFR